MKKLIYTIAVLLFAMVGTANAQMTNTFYNPYSKCGGNGNSFGSFDVQILNVQRLNPIQGNNTNHVLATATVRWCADTHSNRGRLGIGGRNAHDIHNNAKAYVSVGSGVGQTKDDNLNGNNLKVLLQYPNVRSDADSDGYVESDVEIWLLTNKSVGTNPSFDVKFCSYKSGYRNHASDCESITIDNNLAPTPNRILTLSTEGISTTVTPKPNTDNGTNVGGNVEKTFEKTVTVNWIDLLGTDEIQLSFPETLPSGWKIEYDVGGNGFVELGDQGSTINLIPTSFPDGSMTVTYKVTVPLYEEPGEFTFNPVFTVIE